MLWAFCINTISFCLPALYSQHSSLSSFGGKVIGWHYLWLGHWDMSLFSIVHFWWAIKRRGNWNWCNVCSLQCASELKKYFSSYLQVNSAAHLYGDHPYDASSYPSENPCKALEGYILHTTLPPISFLTSFNCAPFTGVSFFAIGEGWHNWHHKVRWRWDDMIWYETSSLA